MGLAWCLICETLVVIIRILWFLIHKIHRTRDLESAGEKISFAKTRNFSILHPELQNINVKLFVAKISVFCILYYIVYNI